MLASLPSRLIAEALDRLPIWLYVAAYSPFIQMDMDTQLLFLAGLLLFWLAWATAAFWLFRRGQTPGKRLMGIKVVKRNGDPAGWWRMFARETLIKWFLVLNGLQFAWYFILFRDIPDLVFEVSPYGLWSSLLLVLDIFGVAMAVGYLLPLWERNRRALHDKVMGTVVVRARR